MKLEELKEIKAVELNLENCEVLRVDEKDVQFINFENIKEDMFYIKKEGSNILRNMLIAEKVDMQFNSDAVAKNLLCGDNGEILLKERILACADIVSMNLIDIEGNSSQEIYVPWNDQDDYVNSFQNTTDIDGCLSIEIQDNRDAINEANNDQRIMELEQKLKNLEIQLEYMQR